MKYLIYSLMALSLIMFSPSDGTKDITPDNNAIDYVGRFCFSDSSGVTFDWPGSCFRCMFTGKTLGIKLEGEEEIMFNIYIDNKPYKIISCNNGEIIRITDSLKQGRHTLKVIRRNESFLGVATFKGLVLDANAKMIKWKKSPVHRIEYIGNSITCGYGVEAENRHEDFKAETENNYLSYAAILSRAFNADYTVIAHSGSGVVRHYGDSLKISGTPQMPARYLRTLDNYDSILWDFSASIPDVVMINLGTNDFSTRPHPDKEVFQQAYKNLIMTIRRNYGNIPVFCISGPLIGEPCGEYIREITENIKSENPEDNITFIGIPKELLSSDEDFGADEHPSVTGQMKIARFIVPVLANKTGWRFKSVSEPIAGK